MTTAPSIILTRLDVQRLEQLIDRLGDESPGVEALQAELDRAAVGTRKQIAFYGSTPAYRPVLEMHGWGEVQDRLNALSKQGEWDKMGTLITDEILNTFAVVGLPEQIAPELNHRYGDVIQRISFYAPYSSDPERWSKVMSALQSA